jgi:hypothetical protein
MPLNLRIVLKIIIHIYLLFLDENLSEIFTALNQAS